MKRKPQVMNNNPAHPRRTATENRGIRRQEPGFELTWREPGQLHYRSDDGREYDDVQAIAAFPISDPLRWISLCDASGHEIDLVEELERLPEQSQQPLRRALGRRGFRPVIQKIIAITRLAESVEWQVETDRGPTRVHLRGDDDIRRLEDEQFVLVDIHGVRYLIQNTRGLDSGSRKLLEQFM